MAATTIMPGSFLADPAYKTSTSNPVFLPPRATPPAHDFPRSSRSLYRTISTDSRKRPRSDAYYLERSNHSRYDALFEAPSPAPFVNTRYRLAGGSESPAAADHDFDYEQDCRPRRFANNALRTPSNANTTGWSQTAWTVAGSLAGKVLSFCWNTAFGGFHAGGGAGYDTIGPSPTASCQLGVKHDVFSKNYKASSTTVPGYFDEETSVEQPIYVRDTVSTPTPTQSCSQSCSGREDWVLVDTPDGEPRRRARPSLAQQRRKSSFGVARGGTRPSSAASFASPRGTSYSSRPTSATNEHRSKRPRPSLASPRRTEVEECELPASPEVVHFQKKMRRKDQVQNESLKRLNQQLKDMIRQGEQALASRIEVESATEDCQDEGYFEDSDRGYDY